MKTDKIAGESKGKSSETKVIVIKQLGHRILEAKVYKDEDDPYNGFDRGAHAITLAGDALMVLVISLLQNMRAEIHLTQGA